MPPVDSAETSIWRALSDEEKPRALFVADKPLEAFSRARQIFTVEAYALSEGVDGDVRAFRDPRPARGSSPPSSLDEERYVRHAQRHGKIYVVEALLPS